MYSLEIKTTFPQEIRFRFALKRSSWITLLPVKSCSGCQEAVQDVLSELEMAAYGFMKTMNTVLADIIVVAGEFDVKKLEMVWSAMKQPKKAVLIGNCVLKAVKILGLSEDVVALKGCPLDQNDLKTFLTL